MEAKQLQQYFNELAEKMMKGEITTDQACSLFKEWTNAGYSEEMEALEDDLSNAEKEVAELKENNILVPKYWYIDEETNEKVFDTDEMESVFHDAMVDLGAYNEE